MANGLLTFSLRDYSKEQSGFTIQTGAVTAVSLPGLLTQIGTLRTALEGITLGVVASEQLTAFSTNLSAAVPASENAQRERKWLVRYVDVLPFFDDPINAIPNEGFGRKFVFSVPTADFVGMLLPNTDFADLADPAIAPFVAAFEAIARSPYGGTVEVIEIEAVGRNL